MVITESIVKKALEHYYQEKYKDLPEDDMKKKVKGHLKVLVIEKIIPISKSQMSYMDYSSNLEEIEEIRM